VVAPAGGIEPMTTASKLIPELEDVAGSVARLRRLLVALQESADRLDGPKPQEPGRVAARRLRLIRGGRE